MIHYTRHIKEIFRFALVGITAGAVHYGAGMVYMHYITDTIILANIMAYVTALGISIVGHSLFSFRMSLSWERSIRFTLVSLSALGISTLTAMGVYNVWGDTSLALLGGIVVSAGYTFVVSKVFAFR